MKNFTFIVLKVHFVLFILFFGIQQLSAQGTEIGINFCPSYAHRTVKSSGDFSSIYKGEKPILAYSLGMYMTKALSSNVSIRTGLDYSRMGFSLGKIHLRNDQGEHIKTITPKRYFDYLTIPVTVQYHWSSNKKIVPIAEFGLSNSLFIAERFNPDNGEIQKNNQSQARQYQLGLLAGIGAKMNIKDRLVVTAISNLHYMPFTVEDSNNPIQRKLYAIGINCMVGYIINGDK